MWLSRQGYLCNLNIKQVLMAKYHNKKAYFFFYQLSYQGSNDRKIKNHIDNDAGTIFTEKWVFLKLPNTFL